MSRGSSAMVIDGAATHRGGHQHRLFVIRRARMHCVDPGFLLRTNDAISDEMLSTAS